MTSPLDPAMNLVSLVTFFYCSTLFVIVAIKHSDQLKYLGLTSGIVRPARVFGLWRIPRLSPFYFNIACGMFLFCLAFAALGIATRVWLSLAIIVYFLYFGQIRTLSYVVRKTNLIPQFLQFLALAHSARTMSLCYEYSCWPMMLLKLVVVQVYLSGAYSKLRNSGLRWASGTQLQGILIHQHLLFDIPLAFKLAGNRRLCAVFAGLVLFHQLTFPVIFAVRVRRYSMLDLHCSFI